MSIKISIKFLETIKQRFKRTISWNKYRSEITTQTKNNNIDYLTDPTFRNINRLFVLSFKNVDDHPSLNYFLKFFMPLVETNKFNILIDKKPIVWSASNNKQGAYGKLIEMSKMMTTQQETY